MLSKLYNAIRERQPHQFLSLVPLSEVRVKCLFVSWVHASIEAPLLVLLPIHWVSPVLSMLLKELIGKSFVIEVSDVLAEVLRAIPPRLMLFVVDGIAGD